MHRYSEYEGHDLVLATPVGKSYELDSMRAEYFKPLVRRAAVRLAGVKPLELPPATRAQSFKNALTARRKRGDDAIAATSFPMGVSRYSLRHEA